MLYVDLDEFWKQEETAHKDNCFNPDAKQAALGIRMSDECVFSELGVAGHPWLETPRDQRMELNKRYNDKAEKIVGIRLLEEYVPKADERFPYVKRIGEVFGGRYVINNNSEWLESDISTPKELEKLLDRVESMDLREFMLPQNWEREKRRIYEIYGEKPEQLRHVRGPVTLATSIYGVENLIFLMMDEPDLAMRYSRTIGDVIEKMAQIMDEEAGYTNDNAPHGFSFADDNCYLLNVTMYESFGYPILKSVFERFSPDAGDKRYQHSDSAMGHHLPVLGRLNLTGCNFGPTVLVDKIREHMPNTRIDGCLAPFTFMNNDEDDIVAQVKRDCEMAKQTRGLNVATAGSINDGSLLTSMRAVMHAIQQYGQVLTI